MNRAFQLALDGLAANRFHQQKQQSASVQSRNREQVHHAEVDTDQRQHFQIDLKAALPRDFLNDVDRADRAGHIVHALPSEHHVLERVQNRLYAFDVVLHRERNAAPNRQAHVLPAKGKADAITSIILVVKRRYCQIQRLAVPSDGQRHRIAV